MSLRRGHRGDFEKSIGSSIKDRELLNERRTHLVHCATALFIRHGFKDVSVNQIAEAANISVGSLYKYIRAKEDILWLVMDSIYGQLEDLLAAERAEAPDPKQALIQVVSRYLHAVHTVRQGILLTYREYRHLQQEAKREFMDRERRVVDIFIRVIEDGTRSGIFKCKNPGTAALNILMMGHLWALKNWMLGNDIEQFIEQQTTLALTMVGMQTKASSKAPVRADGGKSA